MKTWWHAAPVLAAVLAAGCDSQSSDPVPVHPVSGKVTYGGKPAAGVRVFFYPTSAPGLPVIPTHPYGVTGPDGTYTLSTYGTDDGAPEGGYQVVLLWPPEAKEDEERADTDRLLGWYDVAHSKLTAEVKPGPNQIPVFQLPATNRSPEVLEGVPGRN
jgi:hypothetical protein